MQPTQGGLARLALTCLTAKCMTAPTSVLPRQVTWFQLFVDLCPGGTRVDGDYISCARLLACKSAAREAVLSPEWAQRAQESAAPDIFEIVKLLALNEKFWAIVRLFCRLVKPMVHLMRLAESNMPSIGKVSHKVSKPCITWKLHVRARFNYTAALSSTSFSFLTCSTLIWLP